MCWHPGRASAEEPLPKHRGLNESEEVGRELCLEPDPGKKQVQSKDVGFGLQS